MFRHKFPVWKGKLKTKNRLTDVESQNTSASTSTNPNKSPVEPTPPITATELIIDDSELAEAGEYTMNSVATTRDRFEKGKAVLSGIKSLLGKLESSTDAFGPLKSAISALNCCVDIYERSLKGRKEYDELEKKIEGLLHELTKHMGRPIGHVMTGTVKQMCTALEAELKNIQARNTGRLFADATEESDQILDSYNRVHGYLERLTLNANLGILEAINEQTVESRLARMCPAMSAVYNSAESDEIKRGNCTPGTRQPQVDWLLEWTRNPGGGRTCWMNGMAGTGKTTIAYTVCSRLEEANELGASFFCSRLIPECRQIKRIIPSISYQLARFSLPFRCALAKMLESDPDVQTRALKIQYEKLIVKPLLEVQLSLPMYFTVVIDALDECEDENSLNQILDLILSPVYACPIRFLMSSRPEPEIYQRMMNRVEGQGSAGLVLHELDSASVKADIEAYMKHELEHIPLTDTQLSNLLEQCGVLFIYASTTCRYIEQAYRMDTLDEAVNTIIDSASVPVGRGDNNPIDGLYLAILEAVFCKRDMVDINKMRMKDLLETIICAIEPMTLEALVGILGLKSLKQVDALLQPLRSVLNINCTTGIVATLHASFPDFMLDPDRSTKFNCEGASRHCSTAKACLRMIESFKLQFNICSLPSSYVLDDEVEDINERINRAIPPGLVYACRHWGAHLSLSEYQDELMDLVCAFFVARLLLWIEILNLTQSMRHGTSIIGEVEKWCSKYSIPSSVAELAHDAWQFVSIYANHPVSKSTPHIYTSMLPFWPQSSPISIAYMPKTSGMIQPTGTAISGRKPLLLATWRVSSYPVESISLSSSGTRLTATTTRTIHLIDTSTGDTIRNLISEHGTWSAILSNDTQVIFCDIFSSVCLWDTRTGGHVTKLLSAHGLNVNSRAFSPDSSRVAFGSRNGDVYICSLQERELALGPLKGHTGSVESVAFSPDGLYLASGSQDYTVRIWDVRNGAMVRNPLEGHTNQVLSVSYSPDGSRLASTSADCTIRIWDLQTGQSVLGPLMGHSSWIRSVAFSPDGRFIASGSHDQIIRVYDARTGQTVPGPLQGHTDSVDSVIFSPDSARLFSCSRDGTIRVWNVQDLHVPDVPQNEILLPRGIRSVRYSHSGSRVVSGSADGMVHIWDLQTGDMVLGLHHGYFNSVLSVDFAPNGSYIASASEDCTLRIWDASNGSDLHGPMHGHGGRVHCVRFSPDSSVIASGSDDSTVRMWDVVTGQQVMELLQEYTDAIRSVAFSPDGQQLVSGSYTGILRVLDRHTGHMVIDPLQAHDTLISSVEFSRDGLRILSASWDGSIWILDVRTGQQTLGPSENSMRHNNLVNSAAFSPDGHLIVSCSNDRTIRVWDAENGDLVFGPLEGHTRPIIGVQFSPDGSHVVSCSDDRSIRFWDVSSCRRKTQETGKQGEKSGPSQCAERKYGLWHLNKDGWVVDQRKRRLMWVPSDLQGSLRGAYNDSIITDQPWVKLEFDGAKIGEEWTDCYRP